MYNIFKQLKNPVVNIGINVRVPAWAFSLPEFVRVHFYFHTSNVFFIPSLYLGHPGNRWVARFKSFGVIPKHVYHSTETISSSPSKTKKSTSPVSPYHASSISTPSLQPVCQFTVNAECCASHASPHCVKATNSLGIIALSNGQPCEKHLHSEMMDQVLQWHYDNPKAYSPPPLILRRPSLP